MWSQEVNTARSIYQAYSLVGLRALDGRYSISKWKTP